VISALHRGTSSNRGRGPAAEGTGNDFARRRWHPARRRGGRAVVVDGEVRPMDLIVDELGESWSTTCTSAPGRRPAARARWKETARPIGVGKVNLGRLGYPIGRGACRRSRAERAPARRARRRGRHRRRPPVLMVSIGNGANVGGGTEADPEADPEDGGST
jgi:hypothetical protein